ncbi:MAG: 3-oxoacyl-[acyl-carrier-protein] reductase [Phycisphaerae bacterium]|nr:3-oxoacyl-[acyl-carrier-protein] reductase [Phycisphaerae bacterium]
MLNQQVAIVTGASQGIGRAIALELARQGATVVAAARGVEKIRAWSNDAGPLTARLHAASVDVTDKASIDKLVEETVQKHGKLDILVNNAGITKDGLLMAMSDEDFDAVIDTNLRGAFRLTRAAIRPMIRAKAGRIINITSVTGIMGNPGQANYAAAKAGLIGFTKTVAKEYAKKGILCNAVAPGFIATDMTAVLPDKLKETVQQIIPLQRMGTCDEIAGVVAFLCGPAATYLTGQVITVDGGLHT